MIISINIFPFKKSDEEAGHLLPFFPSYHFSVYYILYNIAIKYFLILYRVKAELLAMAYRLLHDLIFCSSMAYLLLCLPLLSLFQSPWLPWYSSNMLVSLVS